MRWNRVWIAVSVALAACRAQPPVLAVTPAADENVLLVTIDTLRGDELSCYGGPAWTPNLDRLADEGARFTFAHAHVPMTLPSHASILTGLYPFTHAVRDNGGYRLPETTETLATRLKTLGFATGAFVGAFPVAARFGLNHGFDVYDDRFGTPTDPSDFAIAERRADQVVSPAVDWIGRQAGRWFAWVHVYDPHQPYHPPSPFAERYANDPYAGEVAFADSALGPLFERVRSSSRRTLVIATGDHGEALGSHGEQTHGLFAYEATLRIPLIVAQLRGATNPDSQITASPESRIRNHIVSDAPARHVDIVPTVLAALGSPSPAGLPGRSLLPFVNGERDADASSQSSYFEAMTAMINRGWAPLTGVLVGREKYIELPIPELYDIGSDAGESHNAAAAKSDRARVLRARLADYHASPPGDPVTADPDARARLQSLGYASGSTERKTRFTERDDPKNLVDVDQALHRGIELVEANHLNEALPIYLEIQRQRSDMPVVSLHLAYIYWKRGQPSEGIATLRRAWDAGQRTADIRTRLGVYLAETGDTRGSLTLLAPVEGDPRADGEALNALGIAFARAGQAAKALQIFGRVVEGDPSNALALQNIGAVQLQQGRVEAAREAFVRAIAIDPKSAIAHTGLGAADLKSARRREAIDEWKRAVELDPEEFDALYDLGIELVNDGRGAEAASYLDRFIRTAPPAMYGDDIAKLRALLARLTR
jgi:arylsulfatase A-like enzyme/tetratricopeptide (TPR) repeat protein